LTNYFLSNYLHYFPTTNPCSLQPGRPKGPPVHAVRGYTFPGNPNEIMHILKICRPPISGLPDSSDSGCAPVVSSFRVKCMHDPQRLLTIHASSQFIVQPVNKQGCNKQSRIYPYHSDNTKSKIGKGDKTEPVH
jgi:hypothetical protein